MRQNWNGIYFKMERARTNTQHNTTLTHTHTTETHTHTDTGKGHQVSPPLQGTTSPSHSPWMHSCVQGFSKLDWSQSIKPQPLLPDLPVHRPPAANRQTLDLWICGKPCNMEGHWGFFVGFFSPESLTGWTSFYEIVKKQEGMACVKQHCWLLHFHTHTCAYTRTNIAARELACKRWM